MRKKKLVIWMNHRSALLAEFSTPMFTTIIESEFTHEIKKERLRKGENNIHVKEQHHQAEYYRKLCKIIRDYQQVVLFGPTSAKTELHNSLSNNHLFNNINIKSNRLIT
jgi:nitrogenase subunit NifH